MTENGLNKTGSQQRIEVGLGRNLPELCEIQHAILKSAGRAIIATDALGNVIYFNPAAQQMLGYTWSDVIGRQVTSVLHVKEEVTERAQQLSVELGREIDPNFDVFIAKCTGDNPNEHDWTYVHKSGTQFPVSLSVTPLTNTTGQLMGYLGVASDITHRHNLEQDLRIAAIAFDSQAAIMMTDANQNIIRVNQAFTTLTGYTAEEAVGQKPSILKSGRQDNFFYQQMWQCLTEQGHWQGEVWNRRKSGDIYPEWLTINEVRNTSGVLSHYVSTFSDISNLKLAESEIHNLAYYDPLTALPNRRLLLNRLSKAMAASKRSEQFGAVMMIDLDHFKTFNDTRGHESGDRLLTEVANRIKACLRESDTAARQGGDEFIVMLKDLDLEAKTAGIKAEATAAKIASQLNQAYLMPGGEKYFHSASIGVSLFCGDEQAGEALLKQADIALYKAKEAGRNSIHFFDQAMQTALDNRAELESRLHQALINNEFRLFVQAQVNEQRQLIGGETLIRWQPPGQPMVSPDAFIPLAEESGLIVPIGLWVLDQACAHLRRWADHPLTYQLNLSVNVSAKQFRQNDFVEQVQAAIERHQIDPRRLKLELTESLLLDVLDSVVTKMQALRTLGIHFSLDDFGTGYASLSYLKRFPFEQLKIDRSFIRDITTDPDDAAIVRAIIAMGNALRLNVVAEGVETDEQHAYLVEHACVHFQGYLFGRPMPFEDFEKTLGKTTETPDAQLL